MIHQVVSNGEVWNGRLSTTGTFVSGLMIPPQSEQMRKKYQTDTSMFMGPTCLIPSGIDPAMPKTTWLQDARRQTVWTGSTVAVQDVDEMQQEFFALAALKQRIADLQGLIAEKEFRIVDADGDGKLSKKELANAMPSASATEVHTLSPQTQMRARLITVPVILRSHARTHTQTVMTHRLRHASRRWTQTATVPSPSPSMLPRYTQSTPCVCVCVCVCVPLAQYNMRHLHAAQANVKQVFRGWSEPKLSQPPGSHRVSAGMSACSCQAL